MNKRMARGPLALLGLLFASSFFIGCGVSPQEVARRVAAAEREGYREGAAAERARCHAEIESLKDEHQQKVAALEGEISSLENKSTLLKAAAVSAWAITGLTLVGGAATWGFLYVRRRRRDDDDDKNDAEEWSHRKAPPSVTQEP